MRLNSESAPSSRRRAVIDIVLYGLCSGLLIVVLKLTEYRFLVVEHSVEIYVGLVAALFAGLGIWLGLTLTRKKPATIVTETIVQEKIVTETIFKEIPAPSGPFATDEVDGYHISGHVGLCPGHRGILRTRGFGR